MTGKDFKECREYLLSLNIAARKFKISYSFQVDYKFNKKKCNWIIRQTIYKWDEERNKRLETVFVNDLMDMIDYITNEMKDYV